jgi:hypothetical protein
MSSTNPSRDDGFIRLSRDQRNALVHDLWLTMTGADDLKVLVERRGACSPAWRCALYDAMWLLDDLGSEDDEPRDEYYVTLPAHRFEAYLCRTRESTIDCLHNVVYIDPEDMDRELDIIATCDQLARTPRLRAEVTS